MTTIEYWPWRYRATATGRTFRTAFRLTAEQASAYRDAERIDGSLALREVDEHRVDTTPAVFRAAGRG
ncbi:MAG: hypothetical protein ABI809_00285 [Caldimonas sp.]